MPSTDIPSWFRRRRYLHFDSPIGLRRARLLVENINSVASHSFYPFIHYTISSSKLKRDDATNILVKTDKDRPIAYASHLDAHIYSYYAWMLGERYEQIIKEKGLSDVVLAFRPLGKSNIDFAAKAFSEIRTRGPCTAVALDISGFFDNLDHVYLKEQWAGVLGSKTLPIDHYAVFRSITKFAQVDRDALYNEFGISIHNPKSGRYRVCSAEQFRTGVREKDHIKKNTKNHGIPQGTPISALLSNIYMVDFDVEMLKLVSGMGGVYFRYCDDMLFIVPTAHEKTLAGEVRHAIKALKLDINTKKTEIRQFRLVSGVLISDKPLQYLGFTFDGQRALIRSAGLARFSQRMKRGVRLAKATLHSKNKAKLLRGASVKPLYKRKLYQRYSHLGGRNFIRYGYRAAELLDSPAIRKQLRPLWERLIAEIAK